LHNATESYMTLICGEPRTMVFSLLSPQNYTIAFTASGRTSADDCLHFKCDDD